MTRQEIETIWNNFSDCFSISEEIKRLKEKCELHGCDFASIGSSWCNKKCELKELIFILEIKMQSLRNGKKRR